MYVNVHFDALSSFYGKGPYFHKLGPLSSPKVFVTLGKNQSYMAKFHNISGKDE